MRRSSRRRVHRPSGELTELVGPADVPGYPRSVGPVPLLGSSTSTTMAATPTAMAEMMSARSMPEMNAWRATAASRSPSLVGTALGDVQGSAQ